MNKIHDLLVREQEHQRTTSEAVQIQESVSELFEDVLDSIQNIEEVTRRLQRGFNRFADIMESTQSTSTNR